MGMLKQVSYKTKKLNYTNKHIILLPITNNFFFVVCDEMLGFLSSDYN